MDLGTAELTLKADDTRFNQDIDRAEGKARGFGSTLGTIASTAGGFLAANVIAGGFQSLTSGFSDATAAASDLAESQSKVGVVFGEQAGVIKAWAADSASSFGLSNQKTLEYAGTLGNLFNALGLTQKEQVTMSQGTIQLAADLASFNNIDPTEALEKLRAGLVGEAEPLRALGVNLTAAAVEAKAMELGLVDASGAVTESGKVQARYALIMEQTTLAQGDFARTSDGQANKQRILNAEIENSQAAIGEKLLPIQLKMTEAKLGFVNLLTDKAIPALELVTRWFGQEVMPVVRDLGQYFQQNLMPIISRFFGEVLVPLARQMVEVFKTEVIPALRDFFRWFEQNILPTLRDFAGFVEEHVLPALRSIGLFIATEVLPRIFKLAGYILETLLPIIGDLVKLFRNHVAPVLGDVVDVIRNEVLPALGRLGLWIEKEVLPVLDRLVTFIARQVLPAIMDIVAVVLDHLVPVFRTIVNWVADNVVPAFEDVAGVVGDVVGFISDNWPKVQRALEPVFNWIVKELGPVLGDVFGSISDAVGDVVAFVQKNWPTVQSILEKAMKPIELAIVGPFEVGAKAVEGILGFSRGFGKFVGEVWASVTGVFEKARGTIEDYILDPFEAARDKISSIVKGIGNNAISVFNGIMSKVAGFVNGFADAINGVAGAIGLDKIIPTWQPPQIQALARGTSFFRGNHAIAGEAGPELITPPEGSTVFPHDVTMKLLDLMQKGIPVGGFPGWDTVKSTFNTLTDIPDKIRDAMQELVSKGAEFILDRALGALPTPDLGFFGAAIPELLSKFRDAMLSVLTSWTEGIKADIPMATGVWQKPLPYYYITQRFGRTEYSEALYRSGVHSGYDLAAGLGTPIWAADGGRISMAGDYGGYGKAVMVDHGDGLQSLYGHMERILVGINDLVQKGEQIGTVDSTGYSTGHHLHFEARKNGWAIDPTSLVALGMGGLVRNPALALVAERQPEIVSPIPMMQAVIRGELARMGGLGKIEQHIHALTEEQVTRATRRAMRQQAMEFARI